MPTQLYFPLGKSEENTLVPERFSCAPPPPVRFWPINTTLLKFCLRARKPKHPIFLFCL